MTWILPLMALLLLLALNWNRFRSLPAGEVVRMALMWGAIIVALVLLLRLLGY